MPQQPPADSWLPLRRELFSVTLDPQTYREIKRGLLPVGTLVENAPHILIRAVARKETTVEVWARANAQTEAASLEHVATAALRAALHA
jgi:hypothetical protein